MRGMKILSVEPTPSPNVMKLNIDEALPAGQSLNFTRDQKKDAPETLRPILAIEGVKGVFQVNDFIAVERNSKADWKEILTKIRLAFGESLETITAEEMQPVTSFGEIQVLVQTFKGIPIQVKLLSGSEERRFGLPELYRDAVMKIQVAFARNYILERKWDDQGVRYGSFDEIGTEVVQELVAAYDKQRIENLIHTALSEAAGQEVSIDAPELSAIQLSSMLADPNWEKRFAALERMNPTSEDIPVLAEALDDPKASIRRLATVYLGMIATSEVLPYLFRALQDSSASVRRTAGDALSDIGNPLAILPMTEALHDPNKLVRWRAARFLYEVGDETALPALAEAQHDPEFEVSLQAKMALERIERGEAASGTVWQQMTRKRQ